MNASVAAHARGHMGSSDTRVCTRGHTYVYDLNSTRGTRRCAPVNTHMYIYLRHTHKCVELENKHVLLGKLTHMCTPGTHVCVHLQHANVFTWNTHSVFTWNTIRTRVQFRHICIHVEHTCVHLEHKHVQLKHTCVYTWDPHTYTTGTQICAYRVRLKHMCVHVEHMCAHMSKHKCSPKAHTHMCAPRKQSCVHICSLGTQTRVTLEHTCTHTWNTHVCTRECAHGVLLHAVLLQAETQDCCRPRRRAPELRQAETQSCAGCCCRPSCAGGCCSRKNIG